MKKFGIGFVIGILCVVTSIINAAAPEDFQGAVKGAAQRIYESRDDLSGAITTVTFTHHKMHEGDTYRLQYTQSGITTINDESAIVFSTPATGGKKIHIVVEGFAEDKVEFRLIETPSVDEGEGTAVSVPFNKDRGSSNTSVVFDAEPVKAVGVMEWTDVAQELDIITIGDD